MIIFAVTKEGFLELEPVIRTGRYHIWIGSNVLSDTELNSYREQGIEITNFNYAIDPANKDELDGAINTIAEHHPGVRVWIECRP